MRSPEHADVVIVGAGAAGLATAIFSARRLGPGRVLLLDSAQRPGAKILVSGGGRCNVTNREVTERDFAGGPPHLVRRVLRAFGAKDAVAFFQELGVALHEEEHGKLFPDTHKARTVLHAPCSGRPRGAGSSCGAAFAWTAVETRSEAARARGEADAGEGLSVRAGGLRIAARRVVLATGGLSLPKTGSDGGGYALAQAWGTRSCPPLRPWSRWCSRGSGTRASPASPTR